MAYLNVKRNPRTGEVVSYRVKYRVAGKEKVETFGTEADATEWRDLVNLVGHEKALKVFDAPAATDRATVAKVVADHIAGLSGIEPGTRHDYYRDARLHINPHLGEIPAADLTRRQVSAWVNRLESDGAAAKSIKNRHALLSAALTTAADEGIVTSNVAKGVRLPELPDAEMVFLEPEEFAMLLEHLKPRCRPLVRFLAGTGLRWAEATALRVGDVDLAANSLHVRQSWKHMPGSKRLGLTKTRAGRRTVEFQAGVASILAERCQGRPADAYVFTSARGEPVNHGTFHGYYWRPAVRAAMAWPYNPLTKEPRIHDLRHSFASWCLNDGVPIYVLSKALGHKSTSVTTDRYGHLQKGRLTLVARAADAAIGGLTPQDDAAG